MRLATKAFPENGMAASGLQGGREMNRPNETHLDNEPFWSKGEIWSCRPPSIRVVSEIPQIALACVTITQTLEKAVIHGVIKSQTYMEENCCYLSAQHKEKGIWAGSLLCTTASPTQRICPQSKHFNTLLKLWTDSATNWKKRGNICSACHPPLMAWFLLHGALVLYRTAAPWKQHPFPVISSPPLLYYKFAT